MIGRFLQWLYVGPEPAPMKVPKGEAIHATFTTRPDIEEALGAEGVWLLEDLCEPPGGESGGGSMWESDSWGGSTTDSSFTSDF